MPDTVKELIAKWQNRRDKLWSFNRTATGPIEQERYARAGELNLAISELELAAAAQAEGPAPSDKAAWCQQAPTDKELLVYETMGLLQKRLGLDAAGDDIDDLPHIVETLLDERGTLSDDVKQLMADASFMTGGIEANDSQTPEMKQRAHRAWETISRLTKSAAEGPPVPPDPQPITSETSDGYHTFRELYEYRKAFNALLFNAWAALGACDVHKAWKHSDGAPCFGGGWFIVVAQLPQGQISNHYKAEDWDLFDIPERERSAEYDGHTPQIALERMLKLASALRGPAVPPDPPALSAEDIAQIAEGIENFIMNGDPAVDAIWQPYVDKLKAVLDGMVQHRS